MKLRKQFFLSFLLSSVIPVLGAITVVTFLLNGLNKRSAEDTIDGIEKAIRGVVVEKEKSLAKVAEALVSRRHPYVGGVFESVQRNGTLDETLFVGVGRYWLKGFDLDVLALLDEQGGVLDAPFNSGIKNTTWENPSLGKLSYRNITVKRQGGWAEVPMVVLAMPTDQNGMEGAVVVGREVSVKWFETIANDSRVELKLKGRLFEQNKEASGDGKSNFDTKIIPLANLSDKKARIELKVTTGLHAVIHRIKKTGLWAGVLAVSFSLLLSLWVSKRLTGALSKLVAGAKEVAQGKLGVRLDVQGGDEIATLGHSFNKMSQSLEINQRKLVQTERVAAWQDIAKRLAHEIKNPLTPIKLSVETMKKSHGLKHPDFDVYFAEGTDTVLQEVDRLGEIVKEFSQFAKLPELNIEKCNLLDCLNSTLKRYEGKIDYTVECELELPVAFADRNAMVQIFLNLIENAMAANSEGMTQLVIKLQSMENFLEIELS